VIGRLPTWLIDMETKTATMTISNEIRYDYYQLFDALHIAIETLKNCANPYCNTPDGVKQAKSGLRKIERLRGKR
jgi:hypothetical protein